MRPQLPLAPTKRQRIHHSQFHFLAVESSFYLYGMLVILAAAEQLNKDADHGQNVKTAYELNVLADSGLTATAGRQSSISADDSDTNHVVPDNPLERSRPRRTPARWVFRRPITSSTVMRTMHVTQAMVECLGLYPGEQGAVHGHVSFAGGPHTVSGRAACTSINRPSFRCALLLRDSSANKWPVVYEATTSCRQYHRRLSDGWAAFCKHHGVKVNDVIEFRRVQKTTENGCLAVRVLRRKE